MVRASIPNTFVGCLLAASIHASAGDAPARLAGSACAAQAGAGTKAVKEEAAWIGVYFETVSKRVASKLGYPHETGVVVSMVISGGPAEKHGVMDGDIIHSFGGVAIRDAEHFVKLVQERRPGETASLEVFRKGVSKRLDLRLGGRADLSEHMRDLGRAREEAPGAFEKELATEQAPEIRRYVVRGRTGLILRNLSEDLAAYFGAGRTDGALVIEVEKGSVAQAAGVRSGDVIVGVNGVPVAGVKGALDAVAAAERGDTLSFDVLRKGSRIVIRASIDPSAAKTPSRPVPFEGGAADGKTAEKRDIKRTEDPEKLRKELEELKKRVRDLENRLREAEKR